MLRHTFESVGFIASLQDPARGRGKPFAVPFDYLMKVFSFDDESVYVRDDSCERMITKALDMALPRKRHSWLHRVNPDAPVFEKTVPAGEVANVPDLFGAFAAVAAMPVSTGIKVGFGGDFFYTKYIDMWRRKGLALGIKKAILNEHQADAGNVIFSMQGFYREEDGNFLIHRLSSVRLDLHGERFTGLVPEQWMQESYVSRHLTFAQKTAECLFRGEQPDLFALARETFWTGGKRIPSPWAPPNEDLLDISGPNP